MHFNSTQVRLEVLVGELVAGKLSLFQFHSGTIRRKVDLTGPPLIIHFNSTQVRLEASDIDDYPLPDEISIPLRYD